MCGSIWETKVPASQVCAVGERDGMSVCQGDSGGPLLTRVNGVWEQGGVVSSGDFICGNPNPTFFTVIDETVYQWIKENLRGSLPKRRTN